MEIGVFATFMSPIGTPEVIGDFAQRAEDAGLDALWMGEHVVLFDEMEFGYPGTADGKVPVPQGGGLLDTVGTFGYVAACTKRIRLGTGVTLIPQRNPVYTAKEFATLDWLSKGRMDLGIGVGWCKEEVEACGYTFEDRGARCDEFLDVMKLLWTEREATYDGQHVNISKARMDPKPVQTPHVPIVVGGHKKRSLRRAAQYGNGWYGFRLTPEQLKPILEQLDLALEKEGRSREGYRIFVTPTDEDEATIAQFAELGVDQLVLQLGSQRPHKIDQRLPQLENYVRFAKSL